MIFFQWSGRIKKIFWRYWTLLLYVIVTFFTEAFYQADTYDYVSSVLQYEKGVYYRFLEFAHILWRPLLYLLHQVMIVLPDSLLLPDKQAQIAQCAFFLCWLSGFVAIIFLIKILGQLNFSVKVSNFISVFLILSNAFLNFSQEGSAYVPSVTFLLVGFYYLLRLDRSSQGYGYLVLAGSSFAISLCIWAPGIMFLPGALLFPSLYFSFSKKRISNSAIILLISGIFVMAIYLTCIYMLGLEPVKAFKDWISFQHSFVEQLIGFNRVIFGLPKTFINMFWDGILIKRYLLDDPYNPVSLLQVIFTAVWKLFLFYLTLGFLLLFLSLKKERRRMLMALIVACLPMLVFATTFDGAANERYFPILTFFLISLAYALNDSDGSIAYSLLLSSSVVFFMTFAIVNLNVMYSGRIEERRTKVKDELLQLMPFFKPNSAIIVISGDDLATFNYEIHPEDYDVLPKFETMSLVEIGWSSVPQWKQSISSQILSKWNKGDDVWIRSRFFSDVPLPEWGWVELQDYRIKWRDIIDFVRRLDHSELIYPNGASFARILPTISNMHFLDSIQHLPLSKVLPEENGRYDVQPAQTKH